MRQFHYSLEKQSTATVNKHVLLFLHSYRETFTSRHLQCASSNAVAVALRCKILTVACCHTHTNANSLLISSTNVLYNLINLITIMQWHIIKITRIAYFVCAKITVCTRVVHKNV